MTVPAAISAEIRTGEAFEVIPVAQARMVGGQKFMAVYQFVGLFAGMVLSSILAQLLPFILRPFGTEADWGDQWLVSLAIFLELLGTVLGYAIGWNLAVRRHAKKFLAGVKARGSPEALTFTYAIEPDGLAVSSERIAHRLPWAAILELIRAPEHWVVQVDTLSVILPRRAFADEAAERAFIGAVLDRMAPEARDRSGEAVAFAAGSVLAQGRHGPAGAGDAAEPGEAAQRGDDRERAADE